MLLHCTQKLAAKLPEVAAEPLTEKSSLGSWHANLVQVRNRQCVLFCHDETRYMLFVPGLKKIHFANLGRIHRDVFLMSLTAHGAPDNKVMRAGLVLGPTTFDTATDRSVLSSMNVAMGDLAGTLMECSNLLELDLMETMLFLNQRPVTSRGVWHRPAEEMLQLVESL